MLRLLQSFRDAWSTTSYAQDDLDRFAATQLVPEVRISLRIMSLVMIVLVIVATAAHQHMQLDGHYLYAYGLVTALAVHIFISARFVHDVRGLFLLGVSLLVLSATALVFVAHRVGDISPLLTANLLLLFLVIPMVPWGLREALGVSCTIWALLTSSTLAYAGRFGSETLIALQFFMLTAAFASLAVVARAASARRDEIASRHELEAARNHLFKLSNSDPLTGAWNRRYTDHALADLRRRCDSSVQKVHYLLFDLDNFKQLNDTHGHDTGDQVLMVLAQTFREQLADFGHLIRLGGDEFCALLIHPEPDRFVDGAMREVQRRIDALTGTTGTGVTVSHGYASASLNTEIDIGALYRKADANMYRDKRDDRRTAVNNDNAGVLKAVESAS